MKIVCPSCRVPVAADDVNLSTGLAKCRTCNNVFRFDTEPELAAAPARKRPLSGKPDRVVMSEGNGELTIAYRWFSPKFIFLTFFCIFWDGILLVWYATALASGAWLMALFPVLHVAVGIGLTYWVLCGYVNTTTIRLDGSRMSVRHHPLPWPGNRDYAFAQVAQLYCEEKVSRGRNGVSCTYNLGALLHDGKRKTVISGADSPDLPLFLEQHAEAWMRITDVPVAGEFARQ
ncbi:MAG TPA: hypothetical protein VFJ16_02715 [Longimicrobium sp.]|nr:hypothetical protein [Longimicrobium sp.]